MNESRTVRVHAFCDDAPGTLDATGVADEIRSGRVSVSEVIAAAIARVRAVDPVLNAVEVADFDDAMAAARTTSGEGVFTGFPR